MELRRRDGWRDVSHVSDLFSLCMVCCIFSFVWTSYHNCPVLCFCLMLYSDDVIYKTVTVSLYKNLLFSIICYSVAIMRFWYCFLFLLPPPSSLSLTVRYFRQSIVLHLIQWTYWCRFSDAEKPGCNSRCPSRANLLHSTVLASFLYVTIFVRGLHII